MMIRRRMFSVGLMAVSALAVVSLNSTIAAADQGIYDDKIVLGSHTPLSGPVALWGVPSSNGMRMAVEEANAKGGIHGRKIEFIVEDTAYQQNKAAQAGDKLLKKDKVFALVGALGTPTNMVTMPRALKRGVINAFPLSAAELMYEPFHALKFSNLTPYYDQMRSAVNYFVKTDGIKKVGVLYQDDDFGKDILNGCVAEAKALGLPEVVKTNFKRGSKDFSSQIAKLKSQGAELVCLGTIIGETIGSMATARKIGYAPKFVVSSAGYVPENITLAKGLTEGLYGTGQTPIPYYEDASADVKAWMDRYKARFEKPAVLQSVAGYELMQVFLEALDTAGADLTTAKVAAAIESIQGRSSMFGGAELNFSAKNHLGTDPKSSTKLFKVAGAKWKYIKTIGY